MVLLFGFYFYALILSYGFYKRLLPAQKRMSKMDTKYFILTFGILLLLTCLRGINVGNDTSSYYHIFQFFTGKLSTLNMSLAHIEWMSGLEIGYQWAIRVIVQFTSSYQIFISLIAIFCYWITGRFIMKYSTNIALSVILFFLIFWGSYINLQRQAIALAFVLFAIEKLGENKNLYFFIGIFIASLFHVTALAAILYYFLKKIEPGKVKKMIVLILASFIAMTSKVTAILSVFGIVTTYTEVQSGMSVYISIIENILFYIAFMFLKKEKVIKEKNLSKKSLNQELTLNLIEWVPVICLSISIISLKIPVVTRMEQYFSICYLILIPQLVTWNTNRKNVQIIIDAVIIMLLLINMGELIFRPEWVTEYKYYFFWQNLSMVSN